jgi:hypothetical protein
MVYISSHSASPQDLPLVEMGISATLLQLGGTSKKDKT